MTSPAITLQAALAGRFRIERELGRGGMATVYLALDLRQERVVALKVVHPEITARPGGSPGRRPLGHGRGQVATALSS